MIRVEIRPGPGRPWQPVTVPGRPASSVLAAARAMYPSWQHRITSA